jgi:sugar lactone lactonase YvrE
VLDTVDVDRGCFACMLGGDDGRTLFIVANHYDPNHYDPNHSDPNHSGRGGASDGIVLTQEVDAPHAGRP